MSTLLLLTSALQPSAEVLPGLALLGHHVKILPAEGSALLEAPEADLLLVDGRQDLGGLPRPLSSDPHDRHRRPRHPRRDRGRARRRQPRLGHGRRRPPHLRSGRAGGADQAGHRPAHCRPRRGGPGGPRDPVRRGRGRRRDVHRQGGRPGARPDVQGVRAPQVPRPAPGTGLQPPAAAARRSGATTTSAARAPSTSTSGGCARSSVPRTRRSSAPSAMSATGSCCRPRTVARAPTPHTSPSATTSRPDRGLLSRALVCGPCRPGLPPPPCLRSRRLDGRVVQPDGRPPQRPRLPAGHRAGAGPRRTSGPGPLRHDRRAAHLGGRARVGARRRAAGPPTS